MAIQIKDVAKRAGVSNATVSRVLSNKQFVHEDIRKRVLMAVEELGYHPSRVARSLRISRSNTIGLLVADFRNPFYTSLVHSIENIAYDHQYNLFLCNSDEEPEKEAKYVDLMLSENIAGVIIMPVIETDNSCKKLIAANIPVVALDRRLLDSDVDTVVLANASATIDLVNHLVDDGHRRIGAILGTSNSTTGRERLEGYTQALRVKGIPLLQQYIRKGVPNEINGHRFMMDLLNLPEPPTAVVVGNNVLTLGCLRAIREKRLDIPDDIALVAFDEMEWSSLFEPPITVISQPTHEMGHRAADLLFDRIRNSSRLVQEVVLQGTLFIRRSCANHRPTTKYQTTEIDSNRRLFLVD